MPRLTLTVLALCLGVASLTAQAPKADSSLIDQTYRAVALLYSQDQSGSMKMHCTATAFEKTRDGYRFASASHCIGNDDTTKERAATAANQVFYITYDLAKHKLFYPATVTAVGYQHRGDDFATFDVETKEDWPIVPLGDEQKETVTDQEGAPVLNVASPLGLGKQVFHGYISSLNLDRPVIEGDINWKGSMLLQIQAGPGSSGSAIVSVKQRAIVGFLVGTVGGSNIVAIPVSKFKAFREAVKDGKYRWYAPEKE